MLLGIGLHIWDRQLLLLLLLLLVLNAHCCPD